ncbi:MAG: ShlB/FhaC/HecB family hemolysin secretion/activation protein, partial [Asticcacaulis sp.]
MAATAGSAAAHAVGEGMEHYAPPRLPRPLLPALMTVPVTQPDLSLGSRLTAIRLMNGADGMSDLTRRWLGTPVTPRLIAEVEAAIDARLGQRQKPLMARWVPGPGLSAGVLAFDLVPAVVGQVKGGGEDTGDLRKRLGLMPGAALDRTRLAIEIDSLNRYPFRQIKAKLTPRAVGNAVDVDLTISRDKPWQLSSGIKYAGGPGRTWRRVFFNGAFGGLLGRDSLLAFQITASPDAALRERKRPKYAELYLTYTKPVGRRGLLESSFDFSGINFRFPEANYWIVESDGTLGYRYTLTGPSSPRGESDVRFGMEARHERVQTYTGGTLLTANIASETFEGYVGYHTVRDTDRVHAELDLSAHLSPGNVDRGNGNRWFAAYNEGRVKSARYAYAALSYDRTSKLNRGLAWHVQINGQAATGPMPFIDQPLIGGIANVRGYFLPDGSFDDVLIARNELSLSGKGILALQPFVFVDSGAGFDASVRQTLTLASAGVGAKFPLGKTAELDMDI